jgi:hypothetical protein
MTAANSSDPTPSTSPETAIQIQPTPPVPAATASSEVKPRELSRDERVAREIRTLDRILVVLTLALAFFLASFRAANTDIWMHLASGRMIVHGEYPFWQAVDPFSHTSAGWDNHAWLSDVILYVVAQAFGGPESSSGGAALIVLKALLVTALAGVLLSIRRPGQGFWLPAICTSLALLAMSPRLYMQTTIVSLLFLGITMHLLQRPAPLSPEDLAALPAWRRWLASTQRRFALPLLVILWVNLDNWYLLGPITVALYALGELMQDRLARVHGGVDALEPGELKQLGIITAACFAACLISPYHVRAFTLPSELSAFLFDSTLALDPWFNNFFLSPFDERYLSPAGVELYQNVAVLALLPLLLLGVLSFACVYRQIRWWRVLVFVPFAVLAALWTRAVPFFAVVAAPIIALNLQDMMAALAARGSSQPIGSLSGRLATAVVLAALLIVAWPGLLHPRPDDIRSSHRVCWSLTTHDSFVRAADAIRDLRARGVLRPESRAFNLSFEAAYLCAWYCPEEKNYYDLRLSPFGDTVTSDYIRARAELEYRPLKSAEPRKPGEGQPPDSVFPSVFTKDRNHPIDHVIVTGPEWGYLRGPYLNGSVPQRFWNNAVEWTMLYGDGRTMIFGWNDPRREGTPFAAAEFDPVPKALGRDVVPDRTEGELDLASRSSTAEQASTADWWSWYTKGPEPRSAALDDSAMLRDAYVIRAQRREQALHAARIVGTTHLSVTQFGTGAGFPAGVTRLLEGFRLGRYSATGVPAEFSALTLLAVRSARQAIKETPNDPQAHYNLALAIDLLSQQQSDMGLGRTNPLLEDIRQAQIINALSRAVQLNPDFADAHHQLARMYARTRMVAGSVPTHLESQLFHLAKWAELARAEFQRSGEPPVLVKEREKQLDEEVRQTMIRASGAARRLGVVLTEDERRDPEALVRRLRSQYALKAENQPEYLRLGMALQFGLSQQALEIAQKLSPSDLESLPPAAREQQAYVVYLLHIKTGQAHLVRDAESTIRDPRLLVILAAVGGDHRRMDEHLADLIARFEQAQRGVMLGLFRSPFTKVHAEPQNLAGMSQLAGLKREECDARVLRGLMALERGEPTVARKHMDQALKTTLAPTQIPKVIGCLGASSGLEEVTYIHAAQGIPERRFPFDLAPLAAGYWRQMHDVDRQK